MGMRVGSPVSGGTLWGGVLIGQKMEFLLSQVRSQLEVVAT